MYAVNSEGEYYDNFSMSMFNDYDHLISMFKLGWVDRVDWVVPDYFTKDDTDAQFVFLKPVDYKDQVYSLYVSENFYVKVKIIKWSDFKKTVQDYDFKYFSLVLNTDKCVYNDSMLNKFSEYMKR